ncbi:MAG: hypothetical protein DRN12_07810, partial [Thermoplasmata archaeon]
MENIVLANEVMSKAVYRLDTPIRYVKGVGKLRAQVFAKLGVKTVADLLEYFPRDWVFAPPVTPIGMVRKPTQKTNHQQATIVGLIESVQYKGNSDTELPIGNHKGRKPSIFEAIVSDDTGVVRIIWFGGTFLRNKLIPGQVIAALGKVSIYKHQLQMVNPKFFILDTPSWDTTKREPRPVNEEIRNSPSISFQTTSTKQRIADFFSGPIYPATAQLSSAHIKRIVKGVLDNIESITPEFYDHKQLTKLNLIKRADAFRWIHFPPDKEKLEKARYRLKYDELFLMQTALAIRRFHNRRYKVAKPTILTSEIDRRIRKRFPFELTADQNQAISEIVKDMEQTTPMNRLLQGDVGAGKTVVALYAALLAVANKGQVAIMAPTEVLAYQHFARIEKYLKNSRVTRVLFTGQVTGKKRDQILSKIRTGQVDIVVGTVALLSEEVKFRCLTLVVIDEQHKFGVYQRARLREKAPGRTPHGVPAVHCLVMTATPIPRTLTMTVFGDLDVSIIKNPPPGKNTVITRWVALQDRPKAYQFIRELLKKGQQAYFVCPRINPSGSTGLDDDVKAATEEYKKLANQVFPEFNVQLLHAQMPKSRIQRIMQQFRDGDIQVLVTTSLIEVGMDVPNANIMVIEGADRFGLAQLHQLRGRVARPCQSAKTTIQDKDKSYCFLFSESNSETARARLEIMTRTTDGFQIAEQDLR